MSVEPIAVVPLRATMLMRAAYTEQSAWTAHIPFAGWLVETLRPSTFVELGTHFGTSYFAICQALVANDIACKCFAVDTWEGDEHAGEYGEEVFEQVDAYHARQYAGFSQLMRMRFDEAVQSFEDGSIDLLHIDGLHSYEAVSEDFNTWLPKLSARAVVMFHDTFERSRGFGVWRLWGELKDRYPSFEFTHGHGLGILVVGAEAQGVLDCLPLASATQATAAWNGMFERLGGAIDADLEISRLNRALRHQRATGPNSVEAVRSDVALVYRAITTLAETAESSHAPVDALRADVAQVSSAVTTLAQAAESSHAPVDALRADVTRIQDAITSLADALQPSGPAFNAVRGDVALVHGRLVDVGADIAAREAASAAAHARDYKELFNQVKAYADRIGSLSTEVGAMGRLVRGDVGLVSGQLGNMVTELDARTEALDLQATEISTLRNQVEAIGGAVGGLPDQATVAALQSLLDLQNSKLDGISEALAQEASVLAGIAKHQGRSWTERMFGSPAGSKG